MEGKGKRVLLVDDDEDVRYMLGILLVQAGYDVSVARDGAEALSEMKMRRFDVVVTDYRMPRLNGLELLFLSLVAWPEVPVIMISGESDLAEFALGAGAFAWIRKPFESSFLLDMVDAAVRQAAHRGVAPVSSASA